MNMKHPVMFVGNFNIKKKLSFKLDRKISIMLKLRNRVLVTMSEYREILHAKLAHTIKIGVNNLLWRFRL